MAINHPKAGPNSVPSYQLSGIPYVTASVADEVPINTGTPIKIEFPYVTRFFQVENTDGNGALRVGFSVHGIKPFAGGTQNYFTVGTGNKSEIYEMRTKDIFFLGDDGTNPTSFRLIAGLTTIERNQFPILTGSVNGTEGFDGIG
jgi:hypothetical protein